ncbi:NACHT, LRR and PYD domains-containing protein 3-like isoform X3 [Chiloscyllium punctatum]|uniref:NACHT, LRR and PYD domains-containing protein 3-like isoform X3 n=1 Tax=Chiloscyllium punctatum TaxID=137246 RepID=UPI003B636905
MEVSTESIPAPPEEQLTTCTVQDLETPVDVVPEIQEGSNSEEDLSPPKKMKMDPDSGSAITERLKMCDDYQLFQLLKLYRDRLERAIEEGTDRLSLLLKEEGYFTDQEHCKVTELTEKGNRADSSKLLLNLVMEKGSRARRMMWEFFAKQCDGRPKLDKILKEIEELGSGSFDCMYIGQDLSEIPNQLKDAQVKHRATLREQTESLRVNSILKKEVVKIFELVDHYAELSIICTPRDAQLVEHELLARSREHDVWREKHLRREMTKIQPDQLFQASPPESENKSGISSALSGVHGIGKTTMVQKIVYDWATEKMYQQFQFIFSFKFRDLNSVNCKINLRNLILTFYPYFGNVLAELWKSPEELLFIFDGLDEFNGSLNFDNPKLIESQSTCTDPEFQCEVSDIVCSLIQHRLLPGCSVLVTSRPTALHLLEKAAIGVWAEILGMVCDERKEYFNKIFEDQAVAAAVFKHLEENEILYPMSYNPSYCWILGLSLGPFFMPGDGKQQEAPKTITQLYSHYICNLLKSHSQIEDLRDVFLNLGEMAFAGISEKKVVFTNEDLIKYNLQPSRFLSGFLMDLLGRDDSAQSATHAFPHLTIQEFVAALAQFLTPEPKDIGKLLNEAQSKEGGRFEIFLRFVAGLSSPQSAQPLEEFLGPFLKQTTSRVTDWVKEKVNGQLVNTKNKIGKRNHMNTLHYLAESQNKTLAQSTVGSVETFKFCGLRLTPVDCVVLFHVIGLCNTIKHLNLENCFIQYEGLQRLGPVLHKCRELRLKNNSLTNSCTEDLASTLSTNRSLTDLILGGNKLGDSGVKLLSAALRSPDCKIQKLLLWDVGITDSCTEDLISALSTNRILTDLNLGSNAFTDRSVPAFSHLIQTCRSLKWIWLGRNRFSPSKKRHLKLLQNSRPGLSVEV